MDDLWIIIAIGPREIYCEDLLKYLHKHKNRVIFVNNALGYTKYDDVHHIEDFGDISIYRWWNNGIKYAESRGAKYVAILNDDVKFDENFIITLLDYLKNKNLAIVDIENSGNGGGAAWLLDLSYGLRLDERFKWWYGDTVIFNEAKKIGKFERYYYENFIHLDPNGSLYRSGNKLHQLVEQDKVLYNSL